jgi:hypothetical protein
MKVYNLQSPIPNLFKLMHKYLRHGVLENIGSVRRISLGQFWGVALLATPIAWLSPAVFFGLHFLLNLFNTQLGLNERLAQSLLFTVVVELASLIHAFGHIVSGKLAGSAMDALLFTATRMVNVYEGDQTAVSPRTHIARAAGGPLLNLLAAALAFVLSTTLSPTFATRFISINLFFGLGGLLPLPSVDGSVIWREVRRLGKK